MRRFVRVLMVSIVLVGTTVLAGCAAGRPPGGGTTPSTATSASSPDQLVDVTVLAVYQPICGPTRPSPDPSCPAEPVVGVVVSASAADGSALAQATTDDTGTAVLRLPANSVLTLSASDAPPPRITPRPTRVTIGDTSPTEVTLLYESSLQ
jgi:hypothetical protein